MIKSIKEADLRSLMMINGEIKDIYFDKEKKEAYVKYRMSISTKHSHI